MAVEPGNRTGDIIENDLLGHEKINLIDVKFIVMTTV